MCLDLLSCSIDIEKAFKSLMKSGRPDIYDSNSDVNLIEDLYVDLFYNDYILRQVVDDNHLILIGRRGTGKSTIFLRAEKEIENIDNTISVYINLQSVYDEIRNTMLSDDLTYFMTFKNFMYQVLYSIKENIKQNVNNQETLEELFSKIEEGDYIDSDFQRSLEITSKSSDVKREGANAKLSITDISVGAKIENEENTSLEQKTYKKEIRVFSIHSILQKIKELLKDSGITRVVLFLDDFSELTEISQKVIVDSLIAPIISAYNDTFIVKIAAYPGRVYRGNIDSTKLPSQSIDFFDAFDRIATNYTDVEKHSKDFIKRTLDKRLEVYTNNQITFEDIFDLQEDDADEYLKLLYYTTACIPRALGYILNYCFLGSINRGYKIKLSHIKDASIKYFEDNIYPDFINDVRFKQAFYDDKELLNQLSQRNLMDKIVEKQFDLKRTMITTYRNTRKRNNLKQIYQETIKQYKQSTSYWFPTSHFYIDKKFDKVLKTLELYFIVSKFNEGSSRTPSEKISMYGLNYGLCMLRKIDYGKPVFRRAYDYWRQEEFDLTNFIPQILSSVEKYICCNCGEEYDEIKLKVYEQYNSCFKCHKENTVKKINIFESKLKTKIEEWKNSSLPNEYIDILRILFNNRGEMLSAFEISKEIDKHHIAVTNAARTLLRSKYIDYEQREKRYYFITDIAINTFFNDTIDNYL